MELSRQPENIIRARDNGDIDNETLARYAPTIFAEAPHESRSERYCYIPTIKIIDGLRKHADLVVSGFSVAGTRNADMRGFQKHSVRFRRRDAINRPEHSEIIIVNSHNGGCAYRVMSGVYRMICSNGLVAFQPHVEASVRHEGDVLKEVVEATLKVVEGAPEIDDQIERLKSITLTPAEKLAFGEAALTLRYGDKDRETLPVTAADLLKPVRYDGGGNNLWSDLNNAQERMMRGGQARYVRETDARGRTRVKRKTSRAVGSIDASNNLNRALWQVTQRMAELKTAA